MSDSQQMEIFSAAATLWPCGHDTSRPSTRSTDFHRSKSAFFKQSRCGASDEPPSAMGVTSRAGCLRRSAVPLPMRKQERVEVLSELCAMGLLDTRGSDDFAVVSPQKPWLDCAIEHPVPGGRSATTGQSCCQAQADCDPWKGLRHRSRVPMGLMFLG